MFEKQFICPLKVSYSKPFSKRTYAVSAQQAQ